MNSSYSDSDFRALGHVGNSRGSTCFKFIRCHLPQGIDTYLAIYRYNILKAKSNFTLLYMYLHFGGVAE